MYRVMRLCQGAAPVLVGEYSTEREAHRLWETCERLPHDRLTSYAVEEGDEFADACDQCRGLGATIGCPNGKHLCQDCFDAGFDKADETTDYFAVKPEQRNFYQEGVCRPGWIGSMPEPPAAPLYKPNERGNDQ